MRRNGWACLKSLTSPRSLLYVEAVFKRNVATQVTAFFVQQDTKHSANPALILRYLYFIDFNRTVLFAVLLLCVFSQALSKTSTNGAAKVTSSPAAHWLTPVVYNVTE